jgi:glycosyltransferase involved in cell wall biosynthesis
MDVTLIVPAYNEAEVLAACLDSVFAQAVKPEEVIVVDNNSVDATAEIASCYDVRLIRETKQGLSYARNTAFDQAKGSILARIDADTILPPHWVGRVKEQFAKPIVGLTGPIVFTSFVGGGVGANLARRIHTMIYFKGTRLITGYNFLLGCNMVLRKETWEKIKGEVWSRDDLYHEDADLSIHAQPYGEILFDPELYAYISPRRLYSPASMIDYPRRHARGLYQARAHLRAQRQKQAA